MTIDEAKEQARVEALGALTYCRDIAENGQTFGYRTAEAKLEGIKQRINATLKKLDRLFDSVPER